MVVHAGKCSRTAARKKLIWRCAPAQLGILDTRTKLAVALANSNARSLRMSTTSRKQRATQDDARRCRGAGPWSVRPIVRLEQSAVDTCSLSGHRAESVLPSCPPEDVLPRRQSLSAQSPCALLAGRGVQLLFHPPRHTHAQTSWRDAKMRGEGEESRGN